MLKKSCCLIFLVSLFFFHASSSYAFDFYKGRYMGGGIYSSLLGGGLGGAGFFEVGWKQSPSHSIAVALGSNVLKKASDTTDFVHKSFTMFTFSHYQPTEFWEWKKDIFWENSFSIGFADYKFLFLSSGFEWAFDNVRFSLGGGIALNSGEGVDKYDDLGAFGLELYSRIKLFNL